MLFRESFSMALTSLYANKMRSLLTMLGIIIGVGAVIALVSVGMGVKSNVTNSIASLGSNMLIISPGATQKGGVRGAAGSRKTLKYDDAKAIKQKVKNIDYVSPTVSTSYQIVYGNNNWNTTVQGVTPEFLSIRSLSISNGSFITEDDLTKRQRVAVIGTTVAENLFEEKNPVGQTIRIHNQPYKVVGLLASKGQSSMGQDQDDMIYVPLTTAMERMLGITYVQSVNVQVSDATKMDQVQDEIETLLRQRHHLTQANKEDDFTVRNLTSLMETVSQSTSMLTLLLGAIAGISLLVGGIGIMNIMLVSVTERTREIGIRKSLGAKRRDIRRQFIIEAGTTSAIGGLVGILFGCLVAMGIGSLLGGMLVAQLGVSGITFNATPTLSAILISFGVSVGIGVLFGYLPANKAAKLNPIDALRYE